MIMIKHTYHMLPTKLKMTYNNSQIWCTSSKCPIRVTI